MTDTIVELNVGGVFYTTNLETICKCKESRLAKVFDRSREDEAFEETDNEFRLQKDSCGRFFIDRDGHLFRYILEFLRNDSLTVPEKFREFSRLKVEAEFYGLTSLVEYLQTSANREGVADVKFRKISKIMVCGHVALCREVFGETLNESRDSYHSVSERYTSRFFLSHLYLEQAFDMLTEKGFKLRGACASSTVGGQQLTSSMDKTKSNVIEESRRDHYNEFIFIRD